MSCKGFYGGKAPFLKGPGKFRMTEKGSNSEAPKGPQNLWTPELGFAPPVPPLGPQLTFLERTPTLKPQAVPTFHRTRMFKGIFLRITEKGGLSLRGVAFMTVLAVLTVLAILENTLPSFRWSYKLQDKEATATVLTALAVLAVVAV